MPHQFKGNKIIAISVIVLLVLFLLFLLLTGKKGSAPASAGVFGQNGRKGTVIVRGDSLENPSAGQQAGSHMPI